MQNHLLVEKLGSLKDELEGINQEFMDLAPKEFQEVAFDNIKAWAESEILDAALKKGDIAPDFCLQDTNGKLISSVDLRAKGPLVVMFFRGGWCPYCNATLRMIRKYAPHFKARGATVMAISPQTVEASAETSKNAGVDFPILSDTGCEFAQACQIAFVLDDVLRPLFEQRGINFADVNGDDSAILPIPATYVIETDGRVTYSFLETDFTKRAEPIDILNALPALQVDHRRQSLSHKIEFEMAKLRDQHSELKMRSLFENMKRLQSSGIEDLALKVGDMAPDFKLYAENGDLVDSRKLRKQGPLIATFHHGPKSPLCMLALEHMQKYLSKFEAKGASLVSLAPGSVDTNDMYKVKALSGAKFPLVEDTNCQVAQRFGITYELSEDYLFGQGGKGISFPMTATFVIDRSGRILYSFAHCDVTRRAEPSRILKALPVKQQPRFSVKRGPFSLLFGGRLEPMTRPRKAMRTWL